MMTEFTPFQTKFELPPLICLQCATALHQDGSRIRCPNCGSNWPVRSGIYDFLTTDKTGAPSSGNQLNEFNRIASTKGWRAAAEEISKKSANPTHFLEYITSEARADFRFLLPVTQDAIVLDVCGGWGNTTAAFARTCKNVFALDISWDKLVFSSLRAAQEGLENITYLRARPDDIPLPNTSCHIALVADTFECGFWQQVSTNSEHNHAKILQSIWEVLVPGGCLYLGIENRCSYKYLLGGRVPPSNLRFISLLPRSLANRYSQTLRKVDYQETTYSLKGISNLLHQAGFSKIETYYPIPSYPRFRFLADLSSQAATDFMISRLRVHSGFKRSFYYFSRIASALGILPWLAPGFSLIAYKE
jgi:ubiquinone/menaquinone biosynthesis C-methylase UbiE